MASVEELTALLERVREAGGPDEGIDYDLRAWIDVPAIKTGGGSREDVVRLVGKARYDPPPYSGKETDAINLIRRALPGWCWKTGTCHVSDDAWVCPDWNDPEHAERLKAKFGHLLKPGSEWDIGFDVDRRPSGNVPLALIEALLSALIAIEEPLPSLPTGRR